MSSTELVIRSVSDKNKLLAACLLVLVSGKFASVLVYFVQLYHVTSVYQLSNTMAAVKAMGAVFFLVDTTLAITLVALLRRRKSGFDRTDSMLNRIMAYTIGTGLITGAWSLIGLFTSIYDGGKFVYLLVYLVMPKRKSSPISIASLLISLMVLRTVYFNCMLTS